jgi:hypothetical protein
VFCVIAKTADVDTGPARPPSCAAYRRRVDYARLERRMRPGAWSECGFLGETESLRDVLEADAAALAELGIAAKEIADTLSVLVRAPDAIYARRFRDRDDGRFDEVSPGLERHAETAYAAVVERFGSLDVPELGDVLVGDRYEVGQLISLGVQECPWGPRTGNVCGAASRDWRIRNTVRDLELVGSDLIVHLSGEHGFFEGRASPYRTDPRALAELLELA